MLTLLHQLTAIASDVAHVATPIRYHPSIRCMKVFLFVLFVSFAAQEAHAQSNIAPKAFYANPGPWGKLKCSYIYLEPPLDTVAELPIPETQVHWNFRNSYLNQLATLFDKALLPAETKARLLDSQNHAYGDKQFSVFVELADLEAMTASMREVIYPILASVPSNHFHANPILITTETIDEWFRTSSISPHLLSKIKQFSYRRGNCIGFSDVSALLNYVTTDEDARRLMKALVRTRSLMVQFELENTVNVNEIINYWSSDVYERRKDIEPILRSIVETKGVDHLGLSHLLPSNVRKLIYTYPRSEIATAGYSRDCFWTSVSFFDFEPLDVRYDQHSMQKCVQEEYDALGESSHRYGDLVLLRDPVTSDIIHSCVHLADDMVYTKINQNAVSPWIILKLSEVKAYFSSINDVNITWYRLKS